MKLELNAPDKREAPLLFLTTKERYRTLGFTLNTEGLTTTQNANLVLTESFGPGTF